MKCDGDVVTIGTKEQPPNDTNLGTETKELN
jgi:hypothetical protein